MEEDKYKAALERAKSAIKECGNNVGRIKMIESIFPELKESEDERIRKSLLNEFTHLQSKGYKFAGLESKDIITWLEKQGTPAKSKYIEKQGEKPITIKVDDIDAITDFPTEFEKQVSCFAASIINREYNYDYNLVKWAAKGLLEYAKRELEKQGEQKPFDYENANIQQKDFAPKVEPKFKVGDWITDGEAVFHITSYDIDYGYQLETQKGTSFHFSDEKVESKYHLWTIQDAKDGDVLACCDNKPFIFKGFFDLNFPNCLAAYCGVTLENQFGHCNGKTFWTNQDVKPATKEQCNLLFQKMHEAGYEWDAKKKVLNKIKMQDLVTSEDNVTKISDQDKWNNEDIRMLNTVINIFEKVYPSNYFTTFVTGSENPTLINSPEIVKWLKGIKEKALGKLKLTKEDLEALRIAIINLGDMAEVDNITGFDMTFGEAKEKLIEIKDRYAE